ncbi:mitochondrial splicing system protein [Tulasnella sp. JGI-2019a]|nr:mitochondrial splicing system protein [Tulasnella sp. JGI-2019a]
MCPTTGLFAFASRAAGLSRIRGQGLGFRQGLLPHNTLEYPIRHTLPHTLPASIGNRCFRFMTTALAANCPTPPSIIEDGIVRTIEGGSLPLSPSQRRTIYALATPPGKAGVGVIRISGPKVKDVYAKMIKPTSTSARNRGGTLPNPTKMERCEVINPETQEVLDDGLVVYFAAPRSFTTEDVLELHIHSGRAIITAIEAALSRIPGCRPAERGEFTRRAFEAGRMDFTQVEGLRDLIEAETSVQRTLALHAAQGLTSQRFQQLRDQIIYALAMVESIIDFGEGEGIEDGVWETAQDRVRQLRAAVHMHLDDDRRGEILRSGIRLAIFGPPNAGKSSLLNFLAHREAAIVTPLPGTTRDVLELSLDIGGMPVVVADTAGLRNTEDVVEAIGVDRAQQTATLADITICVLSIPEILANPIPDAITKLISPSTIVLLNKCDIAHDIPESTLSNLIPDIAGAWWQGSVNTGTGMPEFMQGLAYVLQSRFDISHPDREPLITHARHRVHLESTLRYLDAFLQLGAEDVVLAAEELRYAAQEVGRVSGAVGVEDILDTVFKTFCIGK